MVTFESNTSTEGGFVSDSEGEEELQEAIRRSQVAEESDSGQLTRATALSQPRCHLIDLIYRHSVDYWFVNLRFVYKLNTKTSYSWLNKPKTLKLNAKTRRLCPPEPPLRCLWQNGNHRRLPHNVLPLECKQNDVTFIWNYVEEHAILYYPVAFQDTNGMTYSYSHHAPQRR